MSLRFGLIGFGRWGQQLFATVSQMRDVRITEVCTRDPDRAKLVPKGIAIRRDWREVVDSAASDAIMIASPPAFHAPHLLAYLDERKATIVEKPLCLDLATAKRIHKRSAETRTPVFVDHTLLFNPAYEKLRALIRRSGLIRLVASEGLNYGPFRSDIAPLWDWSPHDVTCCLDLIQRFPKYVAVLSGVPGPKHTGYPQLITLRLDFRGGAAAWIQSGSLSLRRCRSVSVFTDRRAMIFSDGDPSTLEVYDVGWRQRPQSGTMFRLSAPSRIFTAAERPLTRMVRYFVRGIVHRGDRARFGVALAMDVIRVLETADRALPPSTRP
jgi:predicted dehydrogenase